MKPFKITLKAARINAGLTQYQAAKAIGVSRESIQNYEEGRCKPKYDTYLKMLEVYQVPQELLSFTQVYAESVGDT